MGSANERWAIWHSPRSCVHKRGLHFANMHHSCIMATGHTQIIGRGLESEESHQHVQLQRGESRWGWQRRASGSPRTLPPLSCRLWIDRPWCGQEELSFAAHPLGWVLPLKEGIDNKKSIGMRETTSTQQFTGYGLKENERKIFYLILGEEGVGKRSVRSFTVCLLLLSLGGGSTPSMLSPARCLLLSCHSLSFIWDLAIYKSPVEAGTKAASTPHI